MSEIVDIFVHDESGNCIIQRLLKRRGRSLAVDTARNQFASRKGVH